MSFDRSAEKSSPAASLSPGFRQHRNRGASGHGLHHWQMQRLTAIIMVPLVVWLVTVIVANCVQGYDQFIASLHRPSVAIGMMVFFVFAYYHAYLGLETIYKDYIANVKWRSFLLLITFAGFGGFGIVSVFALVRLYLS
ncbi:MAG: succinate dehydrogenase, hydrophobic membrane anchor protein [Candidatus Symbiobacter sp.]|nr:succinate dehydrogenase, hydrophobic membrane anchor protein [Candidatus Symbiobacter sp.]